MQNEWYTPTHIIMSVRQVLGAIDLDPASCEEANQTVGATCYYDSQQDGLLQTWEGCVFCNPPFGRLHGKGGSLSYQKAFAEKLLSEYRQGHVKAAILLSLGNPSSVWFQPFLENYPVCFHVGGIRFKRPGGLSGKFGFPLAFVYLGPNEQRFTEEFSQYGRVMRAVRGGKLMSNRNQYMREYMREYRAAKKRTALSVEGTEPEIETEIEGQSTELGGIKWYWLVAIAGVAIWISAYVLVCTLRDSTSEQRAEIINAFNQVSGDDPSQEKERQGQE